ncbi:hypothetical protein H920_10434 [Fukomys damarensis]|uniref:Uncharacterized protein n=1 Tax=Fukomys damarensis TaxID=885580 RepID=A0A091DDB3_FUKDA|nr:hypothetical protein H920_10434 [Fukomys damarensis]
MGGTCGQRLVQCSRGAVLEEKEANDVEVGEECEQENSHGQGSCDNGKKPLVESCVTTCQFQERFDITKEVIELLTVAKAQLSSHDRMHQCIEEAGNPSTHLEAHDGRVVKQVADGHKAIKGHDGQQDSLSAAQKVEEVKLSNAA